MRNTIPVIKATYQHIIEVKEVYKSFKSVRAVQGISLTMGEGQFTALLGPNGAGKTTLVEMIEGIQKPDRGEILITGKKWEHHQEELHRIIGLSLQETHFIDKLTVWETLTLFASFFRLGSSRCTDILHLIGLEEKRKSYVTNLSGGQRQRLALGISLLNNPKVLLLDEPTTGLDPNARREIWNILKNLREHMHTSLILTTHYMEEAEQLCDYIIIIDQGRILVEGTREQLLQGNVSDQTAEFTLDEKAVFADTIFNSLPFRTDWNPQKKQGQLALRQVDRDLPEFLGFLKKNNLTLKSLEFRRKTLDDLFISLTGRRLND